jgi:translocation and assembly module TamA
LFGYKGFWEALLLLVIWSGAVQPLAGQTNQDYELCPGITIEAEATIQFNESEQALVCEQIGREPYQKIPWNQQRYFLKNFLTARGYFQFQFDRGAGKQVHVKLGPQSVIRQVTLVNAPEDIDTSRFWQVYGRPMTSDALNRIEKWVLGVLSRRGYPCVDLATKAYPLSDEVVIDLNQPPPLKFSTVDMELIPGTIGGVERRYNAFTIGEPYNSRLVDLTTKRMIEDELVISASYQVECGEDGEWVKVELNNIAGKPKLVTFGIGFDTEEFFIVEGGWKNTRLGEMASTLETTLRASFRQQKAFMSFDWYYAPFVIRHALRSEVFFERQNEPNYESSEFGAKTGPSWSWDRGAHAYDLWASVNYEHIETVRGEGPGLAQSFSLRGALQLTSHDYEYFAASPRQGYQLQLSWEGSSKEFASDYTENRFQLSGTALWNLFRLDPPIWVLGLRGQLASVQLGQDTTKAEYPTKKRLRLGGSQNLRGFGRKKLPGNGALTTAYMGLELRTREILPFDLEPIIFFDIGRYGDQAMTLDPTNFWSPGIGVHWPSIIGTIRATLAYGFLSGRDEEGFQHLSRWQAYLSYGEQF